MENQGSSFLPGTLARGEKDKASTDPAVNEAFNYSGNTYDFYRKLFNRNSLDDKGMTLISSVHLGANYNNAFWNGEQMAYGDGDGVIFTRFTKSLDVVGHELTHGVVSHTSNLEYRNESGALNEHFADVFGSLVKQWKRKQTAAKADWLIGPDIMGPGTTAKSLRTFKEGRAYKTIRTWAPIHNPSTSRTNTRELPMPEGTHQFGHSESRVFSRGDGAWRPRLGKGGQHLVSHAACAAPDERLRRHGRDVDAECGNVVRIRQHRG